jgi:hypothetical protein
MELTLISFRRCDPWSRYVLAAIAICIVSVTSTSSLAQTFQLSPVHDLCIRDSFGWNVKRSRSIY